MKFSAKWKGVDDWIKSEGKWADQTIKKVIDEIEQVALRIERNAKMIVPVDSGDLKGSIVTESKRTSKSISAEIGTDMHYSEVVEFGGIYQRAQPYLIPSFDKNVKRLESTLNDILRG